MQGQLAIFTMTGDVPQAAALARRLSVSVGRQARPPGPRQGRHRNGARHGTVKPVCQEAMRSVLTRTVADMAKYPQVSGLETLAAWPRNETRHQELPSARAEDRNIMPGHKSGGRGIRTREGLPPTRFPSVRPRPLGESSAG